MIIAGLGQALLIFGLISTVGGIGVYSKSKKINPYLITGVILIAIGLVASIF